MVEPGVLPTGGSVAGLARRRKIAGPVVGIRGLPEIGHVAARAGRRRAGEVASYVALGTTHAGVRAGQRKGGERVVIECHACPRRGGVTYGAVLREACRNMVGILCARKVFGMAPEAGSRCATKLIS